MAELAAGIHNALTRRVQELRVLDPTDFDCLVFKRSHGSQKSEASKATATQFSALLSDTPRGSNTFSFLLILYRHSRLCRYRFFSFEAVWRNVRREAEAGSCPIPSFIFTPHALLFCHHSLTKETGRETTKMLTCPLSSSHVVFQIQHCPSVDLSLIHI